MAVLMFLYFWLEEVHFQNVYKTLNNSMVTMELEVNELYVVLALYSK